MLSSRPPVPFLAGRSVSNIHMWKWHLNAASGLPGLLCNMYSHCVQFCWLTVNLLNLFLCSHLFVVIGHRSGVIGRLLYILSIKRLLDYLYRLSDVSPKPPLLYTVACVVVVNIGSYIICDVDMIICHGRRLD